MVISVKTESDENLWRQFAYYSPESSYPLDEQFACICPKQCTFGSLQNVRILPLLDRTGLNSIESSVVGIMTRLRHGCPRNYGSIPGKVKGFISSLKTSRPVLSPTLPHFQWAPGDFSRNMELTIHFHRVPRARMGGAVPPLILTSSGRAQGQPDSWSMSKPIFLPDIN